MFKKKKKAPSRRAPYMYADNDQYEAWSWCVNNSISICVLPDWSNSGKWLVEITMNDKVTVDPNNYDGVEALTKMYEYCKYYYDKNKKDEKQL
jgi:hypothetical protein